MDVHVLATSYIFVLIYPSLPSPDYLLLIFIVSHSSLLL